MYLKLDSLACIISELSFLRCVLLKNDGRIGPKKLNLNFVNEFPNGGIKSTRQTSTEGTNVDKYVTNRED